MIIMIIIINVGYGINFIISVADILDLSSKSFLIIIKIILYQNKKK
jgi:hypothetical protein